MTARPCRDCGAPIEWGKRDGRSVPVNPGTQDDHRETCEARRGQVPDRIKRPSRHAISPSRIKRHKECQRAFYFSSVLGLEDEAGDRTAADAGKLAHDALEVVAVERAKAGRLADPVTAEELHAALEVACLRQTWDAASLALAREVLAKAAPIDLSFVVVDEHGPWIERGWELPVGDGVLVGGIFDVVERIGDVIVVRDWKTGGFREPAPESLPAVGLYAAAAAALWPGLEVRVVVTYLALGVEDEVAGDLLAAASGHAKALARALVAKTRAKREDESAWPGTFGPACARCAFAGRCSTFREATDGGRHAALKRVLWRPVESLTLEEVVAEAAVLGPVASVMSARVDQLRDRGKSLLAGVVDPQGRAVVGHYPVTLRTSTRKGYTVAPSTVTRLEIGEPLKLAEVAPAPAAITHEAGSLPAGGEVGASPAEPPAPPAVERDPRVDPRAGDELEDAQGVRVRVVATARSGRGVRVDYDANGESMAVTLTEWRRSSKVARVLTNKAPEPAAATVTAGLVSGEGAPSTEPRVSAPPAEAAPASKGSREPADAGSSTLAELAAGPAVQALAAPLRALGPAAVIAPDGDEADRRERAAIEGEPQGGGPEVAGRAQTFGGRS